MGPRSGCRRGWTLEIAPVGVVGSHNSTSLLPPLLHQQNTFPCRQLPLHAQLQYGKTYICMDIYCTISSIRKMTRRFRLSCPVLYLADNKLRQVTDIPEQHMFVFI